MKIDLRKLYVSKEINIDSFITIPETYYKNVDIISVKNIKVAGKIIINYQDEIELNVSISGTFILPCSITLEEVNHEFLSVVNQVITQNVEKNQFSLELLDILWENIVSEVPIKVTKPLLEINNLKGDGWELEIEE